MLIYGRLYGMFGIIWDIRNCYRIKIMVSIFLDFLMGISEHGCLEILTFLLLSNFNYLLLIFNI